MENLQPQLQGACPQCSRLYVQLRISLFQDNFIFPALVRSHGVKVRV